MIALVRIGESVGRLPENLNVIVMQAQKDHDFHSRLRSAMLYPVFVLTLTVIVGIGVAWFILPRLAQIFSSLHVTLPTITRILIAVGEYFGKHGTILVPAILIGLIALFLLCFVIWPTKLIGQWLLMHVPGVGKLLTQVELARFGFVLGTLLQAGLPIMDAIQALVESASLHRYKKFYRYVLKSTEEGNSLRQSFTQYRGSRRLIPGAIQQMVLAGEKTGHLPETLLRIGKNFESKTETTTKNLSTILEPILLVIVWIGVVTVALAVVLPVYSLIGQFNP
jgi:type IV pilus assembly protein PilC